MKALLGLGLVLLSGCGGSAQSPSPEQAGGDGGSHSAGSSSSGGAGASNIGGSGVAGGVVHSGGSGVAGAPDGEAGASGGAGGKLPDFPGGAGAGPLACSEPYAGPSGGPRVDGPIGLQTCASIPDEVVLARYKDRAARVPQGLYYEPSESITFWNEPCSSSAEETVARGATGGMGTFVDSFSNEWFHEAVYCFNGVRRIERNLRCDYFDGSKLAKPTPDRLAFLASLLWWGKYNNLEGSVILGHSTQIGDATDVVEMCTLSVTYGDFGLCDEMRLESTKHLLEITSGTIGYTVRLGMPQVLRTLKGDCN